jgi:hypothetical protein
VSRRCCLYLGRQLPERHTCGVSCDEFPFCLPALPDSTPVALAQLQLAAHLARDRARFLTELRDALTDDQDDEQEGDRG